jgi:hypothetical protein
MQRRLLVLDKVRIRFIVWIIVTVGVYLCLVSGAFGLLSIEMAVLPDLHIGIDDEGFRRMIEIQAASQLDYLLFHGIDYLFIISFYPLLRRLVVRYAVGRFFAVGAGVCDLLENLTIDISVSAYPQFVPFSAFMVRVATPLKFFGIVAVLGVLAFAMGTRIRERMKGA